MGNFCLWTHHTATYMMQVFLLLWLLLLLLLLLHLPGCHPLTQAQSVQKTHSFNIWGICCQTDLYSVSSSVLWGINQSLLYIEHFSCTHTYTHTYTVHTHAGLTTIKNTEKYKKKMSIHYLTLRVWGREVKKHQRVNKKKIRNIKTQWHRNVSVTVTLNALFPTNNHGASAQIQLTL